MSENLRAVAAAIFSGNKIMAVKRPNDPEDILAKAWGLPAITLENDENEKAAVKRIGTEKLGTAVEPVEYLGTLQTKRAMGILSLSLWECSASTEPDFDNRQPTDRTGTRYEEWQWKNPEDLIPAAKKGSLCSQLALKHLKIPYDQK